MSENDTGSANEPSSSGALSALLHATAPDLDIQRIIEALRASEGQQAPEALRRITEHMDRLSEALQSSSAGLNSGATSGYAANWSPSGSAALSAFSSTPSGALDQLMRQYTQQMASIDEALRPASTATEMLRKAGIANDASNLIGSTGEYSAIREALLASDAQIPSGALRSIAEQTDGISEALQSSSAAAMLHSGTMSGRSNWNPSGSAALEALSPTLGGAVSEALRNYTERMDSIEAALRPTFTSADILRQATSDYGSSSSIGRITEQIEAQQQAIESMRTGSIETHVDPIPLRNFDLGPNPLIETNNKLEKIERRFEQMLDVAARGAEIATSLQAHAAQFLVKFEVAASGNDRAAARAIRLGGLALLIAIAMPVFQILYGEFWRVPADAASMNESMAVLRADLAAERQAQIETADRIAAALQQSDKQMIEAIRQLAKELAERRQADITTSNAK